MAHSIISEVEFAWVNDELFRLSEFSEESHEVKMLAITDRNFKLFKKANVNQIVGLELPEKVRCPDTDRINLRTLVNLVKKARRIRLNNLNVTGDILEIIVKFAEEFPTLKGLEVELDDSHAPLIERMSTLTPQLDHLALSQPLVDNENYF